MLTNGAADGALLETYILFNEHVDRRRLLLLCNFSTEEYAFQTAFTTVVNKTIESGLAWQRPAQKRPSNVQSTLGHEP